MIELAKIVTSIPTLICAIALCFTDMRYFCVPRLWVIIAIFAQTLSNSIYSIATKHDFSITLYGWISALSCFLLYLTMRKISGKKSIGFGDITCATMLAQALGLFGIESLIIWIALTGLVGGFAIIAYVIFQKYVNSKKQTSNSNSKSGFDSNSDSKSDTNSKYDDKNKSLRIPFVPVEVLSAIFAVILTFSY